MSGLSDRNAAHDKKIALDDEKKFKAAMKRNRLLGEWAGAKLGKTGADLEEYVKEVVRSDFKATGDADVHEKVSKDLAASGVPAAEVRKQMDAFHAQAVAIVAKEG